MKLTILLGLAAFLAGTSGVHAQGAHHGHHDHGGHGIRKTVGAVPARAKRPQRQKGATAHGAHGADDPQTASTRELMAAHHKMMRDMDQPYTGDPDADFRIQMIPHHQGAIDMSRVALRHANDPFTRQLAEAVIVEQQREIAEMRAWLAARGYRSPPGGSPQHVMGWDSYRSLLSNPGSLEERAGKSWAPGSGAPRR